MLVSEKLQGEKIYLKNLSKAHDFSGYCSWLKDPVVNKFLEVRVESEKNIQDLQGYVTNCNESSNTILWGIFNYKNKHIGNIKASSINFTHQNAEIGMIVGDVNYWGLGVSTEAIGLVCSFLTNRFQTKKLFAGAYANNIGSIRAFEKNGFVIEGCQKNFFLDENRVRQDKIILGFEN
tara:strand:+ start:110 stop:643 length:534 start_codon:yes stop_codon:yes gene_type:complete